MEHFLSRLKITIGKFKPSRFDKADRRHRAGFLATALIVLTLTLISHHHYNQQLYVVYLNGVEIGAVDDPAVVNHFVSDLKERCGDLYGMELSLRDKIDVKKQFRDSERTDNEAILEKIRQKASFDTTAYLLYIDGIPVLPLASADQVQDIEDTLKGHYASLSAAENLQEVYIVEEFHAEECLTSPDELCSTDEAVKILQEPLVAAKPLEGAPGYGAERFESSRAAALSRGSDAPESFTQSSMLDIGQFLKQGRRAEGEGEGAAEEEAEQTQAIVHVKTVEEITVLEEIEFETEEIEDASMYVDESKIITTGEVGEKEVVYLITRENGAEVDREALEETVLKEPVTQVEAIGKKELYGASGSSGSGFIWPVQGEGIIYNGFKPGHQAIDIHIEQGTNVLAAADGVVTFNGYGGTQGNYLIVHHGEYWTLYLHNSVNLAKVGERVSRGQVIARVGATGRARGAHLHFEVRKDDGSRKWNSYYQHQKINPLQFYNRSN